MPKHFAVFIVASVTIIVGPIAACGSTSPTATATPTPTPADLSTLLLTDLPAGFIQQPNSVGNTGPSDLAKAVKDDGKPDAQTALTSDGFVSGYQRLWVNKTTNMTVVDFLYRFDNSSGATSYAKRQEGVITSSGQAKNATTFSPQGIPNGFGIFAPPQISNGLTQSTAVAAVDFSKGSYLVQIVVAGPAANSDFATQLAQQEYQKL